MQKSLVLAYVKPEYAEPGSARDIEILGVRCRAKILAERAYDPRNERLRS